MSLQSPQNTTKPKSIPLFRALAEWSSRFMGSSLIFCLAIVLIFVWAFSGFFFDFDNTWQLVINTATTIITFLMVILIQNTQNRNARSIHLKLNELLLGSKNTRDSLMEIEEQSDEEMDELDNEFRKLREAYILHLEKKIKTKKRNALKEKKNSSR